MIKRGIAATREYKITKLVPSGSGSPYDFPVPNLAAEFVGARKQAGVRSAIIHAPPHDYIVFRVDPPAGVTAYDLEFYERSAEFGTVRQITVATGGPLSGSSPPFSVARNGAALAVRITGVTFSVVPSDPFVITWQGVNREG